LEDVTLCITHAADSRTAATLANSYLFFTVRAYTHFLTQTNGVNTMILYIKHHYPQF